MTGKERAALRSQAHHLEPVVHIGKESLTPEVTEAIAEAIEARELIKVGVLKNGSQVIQVMGKKITLYKYNPKKHKENEK